MHERTEWTERRDAMAKLSREKSLQFSLDSEGGKKNVFDLLKEKGIDPGLHLIAVQDLPGKFWDITFKTVELKKRFWPTLLAGTGYTASAYTSSASLVTVLHVPYEQEDNVVRHVLGRY